MKTFDEYLATIPNEENRAKIQDILQWIGQEFPQLETRIAWSQPMLMEPRQKRVLVLEI